MVLVRHPGRSAPLVAEGVWHGEIARAPRGANGFGYDPLFFVPRLGQDRRRARRRRPRTASATAARRSRGCSRCCNDADRRVERPRRGEARGAAAARALRPHPVVRAQVPVLRFQFARAHGRTCPKPSTSTSCSSIWRAAAVGLGPAPHQRLHRRRHAEPVLARSRSTRCSPACARACRSSPSAEITLEANPGTFEAARFRGFRDAGVNRLSIGVQSFDDAHAAGARPHPRRRRGAPRDRRGARELRQRQPRPHVRAAGAERWRWRAPTSRQAIARRACRTSRPTSSRIEPNTVFFSKPPTLPEHDAVRRHAGRRSRSCWQRPASSTTRPRPSRKPGHRCRHNLNYWQFGDYLGIGAGAHGKISFPDRITRHARIKQPREYLAADEYVWRRST